MNNNQDATVTTTVNEPAIRFLRKRVEDGMPLYQGDVDSALAEARLPLLQEIGELRRALAAERASGAEALDVERLERAYATATENASEHNPPLWMWERVATEYARLTRERNGQ